jgi:hypothetical protein
LQFDEPTLKSKNFRVKSEDAPRIREKLCSRPICSDSRGGILQKLPEWAANQTMKRPSLVVDKRYHAFRDLANNLCRISFGFGLGD